MPKSQHPIVHPLTMDSSSGSGPPGGGRTVRTEEDDWYSRYPPLLSSQPYPSRRDRTLPLRGTTVAASAAAGGVTIDPLPLAFSNKDDDCTLWDQHPSGQSAIDCYGPTYGDATVAAAAAAKGPPPLPPPSSSFDENHYTDRWIGGNNGPPLEETLAISSTSKPSKSTGGATVALHRSPPNSDRYHISQSGNVFDLDKYGDNAAGKNIEEMKRKGGPLWKRFAEKAQMPNPDAWKCKINQTTGLVDVFYIRPQYFGDFVTMLNIAPSYSGCSDMGSTFRHFVRNVTVRGPDGTMIPILGVHYNEPSPQNDFKIGSKAMDKLDWIEFWAEHLLPAPEKKIVSNTETIVGSLTVGNYAIIRDNKCNRAFSADNLPSTMEATIGGQTSIIPVYNVVNDSLRQALKKKQMNFCLVKKADVIQMGIDRKDLKAKQMVLVEVISLTSKKAKDTKAAKRSAPKRTSKKAKTAHEVQWAGHDDGGAPIPMDLLFEMEEEEGAKANSAASDKTEEV